jgi:hypothetical protein
MEAEVGESSSPMVRRSAVLGVVGAAIIGLGGVWTQVVAVSSDVSKKQMSYPWSSGTFARIELLWAAGESLIVVALWAIGRTGVVDDSRVGRIGWRLALLGTAGIALNEIALIPFSERGVDDIGPVIVESLFGLATVLSAIGLLLMGRAVRASGRWTGWRQHALLAAGVWTVALIGLQFTPALPSAVAVYGLCMFAASAALFEPARVSRVTATAATR